jgi:hypothetical protein
MQNVRVEIKIKNNILYSLICDNYNSIKSFCEKEKLSYSLVINYVSLNYNPYKFNKDNVQVYSKTAISISEIFKLTPDIIFPIDLYKIEKNKMIITSDINMIQHNKELKMIESNPEYILEKKEFLQDINDILKSLKYRERLAIEMRHGLNGYKESSFEEISKIIINDRTGEQGVSITIARNTYNKAMKKLRHPSRSSKLQDYIKI